MTVTSKQMMARLTHAERKAVEKRAAELIAKEMRLRDVREAFALTQERMADRMNVGQETVSRIDAQTRDMRVSSIAKYLAALGGELELVARFPDRTVTLRDLAPIAKARRSRSPKTNKTKRAAATG